ncbi:MAG: FHA domain-containing protein, partial [Thermodesulfobacteriota bacterium]
MSSSRAWRLGRDYDNDFVFEFPNVSGHHCRILLEDGGLAIEDLGSTNGTYVNGRRLPPHRPTPVSPGDEVTLGSYRLGADIFEVIRQDAAAAPRPPRPARPAGPHLSIGRGPTNDIILDFPQISHEHARLYREAGRWLLEDLQSTNGTYVNDRANPIALEYITEDDTIFFGSYKISGRRLLGLKKDAVLGRLDPRPITITERETILGRDPQVTIHLDYPQVSWHHAMLVRLEDGGFLLQDLNSSNGTYVNGRRVNACKVTPQDTISLGSYHFKLTEDLKIVMRDYRGDIRLDSEGVTIEVYDRKARARRKLIDNVSLTIFPSEFVGLMGPSGAGKTTLMLAMNGYLPPSGGRSLINGQSLYESYDAFRGAMGYVPQDDIIHPELTVYEALYFTARLRLPADTRDGEIDALIEKVMTQLGLIIPGKLDVRHVAIGSPEKKGISGGQRKRVNLAMELMTDPSLLFLDEPTSGLSSEDTIMVMDVLRKLAEAGKTIVLTIHQPSLEAYKKMDNVIILSSGKLMYYGPAHPDSLTFFNPDQKPEEATLDAGNALKGLARDSEQEWQAAYQKSKYFETYVQKRRTAELKSASVAQTPHKPMRPHYLRQWWTLTRRYFTVKRKDTINTAILLLQAPIIAGLIALAFQNAKDPCTPLFLLVVAALWFGTSNSSREIVAEKAIYKRERMVNLKIPSYLFSKYVVLSLLCLIQCLVLVGLVDLVLDFDGESAHILGVTFMAALGGLSVGLFVSAMTQTQQAAVAIVPLVLLPMVILGGGITKIKDMNRATLVLSYAVPSRWAFEMLVHLENEGRPAAPAEEGETGETGGGQAPAQPAGPPAPVQPPVPAPGPDQPPGPAPAPGPPPPAGQPPAP